MSEPVAFTLADGTEVIVAPTARSGSGVVGLGTHLERAQRTLRESLTPITSAASEVIAQFRALPHHPEEIEVSFGVVLDASLGGVIANAKAGAHLDITLRWRSAPPESP
ncbi:CU044_2847 family protein [Actinacidiphila acididurans]|uniref:Trypsin-co-occurring domain-containing protein n=1 Tax=Actinacidiphila acididurans TaxID=2784346 RepID=A0ABS2TTV1_9ACTN|nr:CU044_2847 family protein [Actinacidiphila acididurans]MBM9505931.1 hypothetical protein [Actinacidiphila acididurans]